MEKFTIEDIASLFNSSKFVKNKDILFKRTRYNEAEFDKEAQTKRLNNQQKIIRVLFGEFKDNLDDLETLINQLGNVDEKESLKRMLERASDTFAKLEIEVNRIWTT